MKKPVVGEHNSHKVRGDVKPPEKLGINFVQVRIPHPLPRKYIERILGNVSTKIIVEGNYSGQLAGIIREETGILMDYYILKWNGRPMSTDEVYEALLNIVQNRAQSRQVLNGGS